MHAYICIINDFSLVITISMKKNLFQMRVQIGAMKFALQQSAHCHVLFLFVYFLDKYISICVGIYIELQRTKPGGKDHFKSNVLLRTRLE